MYKCSKIVLRELKSSYGNFDKFRVLISSRNFVDKKGYHTDGRSKKFVHIPKDHRNKLHVDQKGHLFNRELGFMTDRNIKGWFPTEHTPSKDEDKIKYLKDLKTSELLSYAMVGMASSTKQILNLCVKLFPFIPLWMIRRMIYNIYCGGENLKQVMEAGSRLQNRGIHNMMLSLTIEACDGNDNIDPNFIVEETRKSVLECLIPHTIAQIKNSGLGINKIPPSYVALKPTGFSKDGARALRYFKSDPESAKMFDELVERVSMVCEAVYESNERLLKEIPDRKIPLSIAVIDAEKFELQEGVYELQRRLYSKFNPLNKPVSVVGTLQMYLSNSADCLAKEEMLARENGYRLALKLVRGAYLHSEVDRANVIHKTKEDTDANFNEGVAYCIDSVLASKDNSSTIGHLVVATHNYDSCDLATERIKQKVSTDNESNSSNIVLGQLLGMADDVTYKLVNEKRVSNVIKYVPWGPALETKEYLKRRLEENGDSVRTDSGFNLVKNVGKVLAKKLSNFS